MKARLYANLSESGIVWRMSVDMRADVAFWLKQADGFSELLLLEPTVSVGQAQLWLDMLQREYGSMKQGTRTGLDTESLIKRLRSLGRTFGMNDSILANLALTKVDWQTLKIVLGEAHLDSRLIHHIAKLLRGRSLFPEELFSVLSHAGVQEAQREWKACVQAACLMGELELASGFDCMIKTTIWPWKIQWKRFCRRCGGGENQMHISHCPHCQGDCYYCEQCLQMGRNRFCSLLINGTDACSSAKPVSGLPVALKQASSEAAAARWGLSQAQAEAVAAGLDFLERRPERSGQSGGHHEPQRFLIWAVTGAGKTEMIFPLIDLELGKGKKVLIAAPRRDVVLELRPRIEKAFPERSVVTLYGGSQQRWEQGEITVATTHQLLRFRQAFDLIVIDEIDAFPYHNNPMLEYAATKVCKPGGNYILLSATPPASLRREVKLGRMPHAKVPARYHGHPLPVPRMVRAPSLGSLLRETHMPERLGILFDQSVARGAQIFVFVPKISQLNIVVRMLTGRYAELTIDGTSSQDPDRADKVQRFRDGRIRILVTTTILERGVTVPKTDVFILDADSALFDEAALIQMSGRAGRSKDDPRGRIYFFAGEKNRAQVAAIRQIKQMNKIAHKSGFLKPL